MVKRYARKEMKEKVGAKRAFSHRELNQSSTAHLRKESAQNIIGVSSSSTCEIGLCAYSESKFQNIAYLVDKPQARKVKSAVALV